jgi:hypothetical protein
MAAFRTILEDDPDGISDWVERKTKWTALGSSPRSIEMRTVQGVTTYTIDGQQYDRLEDVPEQYRELFADREGDGYPDFLPPIRQLGLGRWMDRAPPVIDVPAEPGAETATDQRAEPTPGYPVDKAMSREDLTPASERESDEEAIPLRSCRDDLEFRGESGSDRFFVILMGLAAFLMAVAVAVALYGLGGP